MDLFKTITNSKYSQRILFYFNLSMVGLLVVIALSFYAYSKQVVLQTQKEANQRVLTQIKKNIRYINDIVQNVALTASFDPRVRYLMNAAEPEPMLRYQTIRNLDTMADVTSFIDSIVVFNGAHERLYIAGSGTWSRQHADDLRQLAVNRLNATGKFPVTQFLPIKLDETKPYVDIFTYLLIDGSTGNGTLPNAVMVNVRPQWIFDNINNLDNLSRSNDSMILVDKSGAVLQLDDGTNRIPEALHRFLADTGGAPADEIGDFSIRNIGGRKYVLTEMSLGINEWKVMNVLPYKDAVGKVDRLRNLTMVLIFVFFVVSFLLSLLIANRLYRPVGKLFELFKRNQPQTQAPPSRQDKDEMTFISDVYRITLDKLQQANREENRNKRIVSDYYMRVMITGSGSLSEDELKNCEEYCPELFGEGDGKAWQLAVIALDQARPLTQADWKQEKLFRFAACNIVEETLSRLYPARVVDMNNEFIVALLRVPADRADPEEVCKPISEALQVYKTYYRRTFSTAVGYSASGCKEIAQVYELTVQQLMYRLAYGHGSMITPDIIASNVNRYDFTIPVELEKRLAEAIRAKDMKAIRENLARAFELIASIHYDYMAYAVIQVILIIRQVLREPPFAPLHYSVELQAMNQKVVQAESLEEMHELAEHFLRHVCEADANPHKDDRNKNIVDTMKEFIDNNYADVNLSMQSIASYLKMSPAYVGRIFKLYENCSVGDYINGYRLEKARELLLNSDYNVKEIADVLGFNNASYFITLYKKKYGTTPKEYRMNAALLE